MIEVMKKHSKTDFLSLPYAVPMKKLTLGMKILLRKYRAHEDIIPYTSYSSIGLWKEIAEANEVVRIASKITPKNTVVWDVGTGVGISAAALALERPDLEVYGIDLQRRRTWSILESYGIENLHLVEDNILEFYKKSKEKPATVVGVHNCRSLSIHDIEIAVKEEANVILLPCCEDFGALNNKIKKLTGINYREILYTSNTEDNLSRVRYVQWVQGLALLLKLLAPDYKVKLVRKKTTSQFTPKDIILVGTPEKKR